MRQHIDPNTGRQYDKQLGFTITIACEGPGFRWHDTEGHEWDVGLVGPYGPIWRHSRYCLCDRTAARPVAGVSLQTLSDARYTREEFERDRHGEQGDKDR